LFCVFDVLFPWFPPEVQPVNSRESTNRQIHPCFCFISAPLSYIFC
jgi:hypothetical protein